MKPDDVSQEAWDAADAVGEAIHGRHERGWVVWPLMSKAGPPPRLIIARAIMAAKAEEREACAQVAENRFTLDTVNKNKAGKPYASGEVSIYVARIITAAIRNRGASQ